MGHCPCYILKFGAQIEDSGTKTMPVKIIWCLCAATCFICCRQNWLILVFIQGDVFVRFFLAPRPTFPLNLEPKIQKRLDWMKSAQPNILPNNNWLPWQIRPRLPGKLQIRISCLQKGQRRWPALGGQVCLPTSKFIRRGMMFTRLGKPSFKKYRNFMKNFHKMVAPPPRVVFVKSLFRFLP